MKIFRITFVNLRRALCSRGFFCCIAAVFVMFFTKTIGYDVNTSEPLTIPAVLMQAGLAHQDAHYCSFQVFAAGDPSWVMMFTPVFAAFAYVPLLCDERRSQLGRSLIARQGKLPYALGHVFAAMLTGALTMLCGYAMFGLAVTVLFPSMQSYDSAALISYFTDLQYSYPQYFANGVEQSGIMAVVLLKLTEMFLYGAFSALPALVCAAFSQNKYTVLCLPFFITYSWTQINTRLLAKVSMAAAPSQKFWQFLINSRPAAMLTALEFNTTQVLLLHGGFVLLLIAAFTIILQRRLDCGA